MIVAADADVEVAAKRIAWMKLLNAGQTCVAPDYVLADATIRDELVDKIGAAITKFTSDKPDGMRVVNQRQFDRISGYLSGKDGTVTVGGACDASTLRIQPAVVVDPDPDGPLMRNEIFGPVLPVITVQNLDEAIRFVNSRPKPLSAYLFTKRRETRERVIRRCRRAACWSTTSPSRCRRPSYPSVASARRAWAPTTASGASTSSATARRS